MSGIEVVKSDLQYHPTCPHGPTLLFTRLINEKAKNFFSCAACRDRKDCKFFLWEDEWHKMSVAVKNSKAWEIEREKFLGELNHTKLYINLNKTLQTSANKRCYCNKCDVLIVGTNYLEHKNHNVKKNVCDYELHNPSTWLNPLDNPKKEAQFLFSRTAVQTIVDILSNLGCRNILSIGVPRVHEYILYNKRTLSGMSSLLLDFDRRFHNFFSPQEFCWYNAFNHHFFLEEARQVYSDFLKNKNVALVLDPPFGGRVEPLADTVNKIMKEYKNKGGNGEKLMPVFWVFPYFMESHILNSFPDYVMLDYKVDYDNHPLFTKEKTGRKFGSPVRIFTNVDPKLIVLPADQGYKFCKECEKWVSQENKHCKFCNTCTSKDGRTYIHCNTCQRCVKPTWEHCKNCNKCVQVDHKCGDIKSFTQVCFHCHERGHKKKDCLQVNQLELQRKRKAGITTKKKNKKMK